MIKKEEKYGRIIVTSGSRYIDIDAYAACVVYANILKKLGFDAYAYSEATLNESVPESIFSMKMINNNYNYKDEDSFIVLDVSDPKYLDSIINQSKIIEVIDHHFGFEEYWKRKLGEYAIIEPIGAVATIIAEYAIKTNYIDEMSREEALLLIGAILDNTLNLKAKITTRRDINAYKLLLEKVQFNNFDKFYFKECEKSILNDISSYIKLDTKFGSDETLPKYFSQIVLYDKTIIEDKYEEIIRELEKFGKDWIINIIELNEGKSFIYSINREPQEKMERLFNKKFNSNNIIELDGLYLRKEIIKLAKEMK